MNTQTFFLPFSRLHLSTLSPFPLPPHPHPLPSSPFFQSVPSLILPLPSPPPHPSSRYTILAASAVPKGFVDAKVASQKVIGSIDIKDDEYRFGHTKARILIKKPQTILFIHFLFLSASQKPPYLALFIHFPLCCIASCLHKMLHNKHHLGIRKIHNNLLLSYITYQFTLLPCTFSSYTLLAPTAIPKKGFLDAKQVTEKLIETTKIDNNDFRYGSTKAWKMSIPFSQFVTQLIRLTL